MSSRSDISVLNRLRAQLIATTLLATLIVLVAILGFNWFSTRSRMIEGLNESLERTLVSDGPVMPMVGRNGTNDKFGDGEGGFDRTFVYCVDLDSSYVAIRTNDSSVSIDSNALDAVLKKVKDTGDTYGTVDEYSLIWMSTQTLTGERVAIADASNVYTQLSSLATSHILLVVSTMLILFVVAWFLSKRFVAPVEKSWDQQSRFVADASHELKTPLAVILANTQILEDETSSLPADTTRWITSTKDEATRMKGLVNDLLELARAEENTVGGGGAFQDVDADLTSIVDSAALEFDAVAFERDCTIESDVQPDVHVQGDPAELMKLVKTLIDNACKYAAPGTSVRVNLTSNGSHPVLTINNQGTPIDPEDLPHVFERFYRSDKSRVREDGAETGGYGLGLAIAQGIAQAHHGKIVCTSNASEGTTFTVTL